MLKHERPAAVTCLLLDVGGVLLTDGWDRHARKRAVSHFKLELTELEDRHLLTAATFENGEISLDEYLARVIFYKKRRFTKDQFRRFMFAQSKPHQEMIDLIKCLKARYHLKIAVISNEGRELNAYRIKKFSLDSLVDSFISSCFVHLRKPAAEMFQLALDVSQAPAHEAVYIDNTAMFVEIVEERGIRSILHVNYPDTCARLARLGLKNEQGASYDHK